jgi:hypothetical protein
VRLSARKAAFSGSSVSAWPPTVSVDTNETRSR